MATNSNRGVQRYSWRRVKRGWPLVFVALLISLPLIVLGIWMLSMSSRGAMLIGIGLSVLAALHYALFPNERDPADLADDFPTAIVREPGQNSREESVAQAPSQRSPERVESLPNPGRAASRPSQQSIEAAIVRPVLPSIETSPLPEPAQESTGEAPKILR